MKSHSPQPFLTKPVTIYCIRTSSLYMSIHKVLLDFFLYQLFLSLTVLNVTIVLVVKIFLTVPDIS